MKRARACGAPHERSTMDCESFFERPIVLFLRIRHGGKENNNNNNHFICRDMRDWLIFGDRGSVARLGSG